MKELSADSCKMVCECHSTGLRSVITYLTADTCFLPPGLQGGVSNGGSMIACVGLIAGLFVLVGEF